MAATDALRLEGVTKRFGAVTALHEAWLKVQDGEFITLLGPSGCGKTTLLNLIAGFLEADAGEIFIGGKLVTTLPVWERDLGMVFQSYALFPHMDVARNVGYGLRARGVPKSEEASRVAEALGLVRLSAMADRRPKQLSGGQQQRVALARALVIRPRLLLLDEPFSALDRNLRTEMQLELKEIQRRLGVTTIFVTHDQGEAMSMSDRVAVMSEGRILQLDTPEVIYGRPAHPFVAGFIGDATVLPGRLIARDGAEARVEAAGLAFIVPAETLGGAAPGAAVSVYLRPEDLHPIVAGEGLEGIVVSRAYLGDRAELVVECGAAGRLMLRLPGQAAMARWPVGAALRVGFDGARPVAFPA
ncbi:ABC transporter ATP-binding protein [Roseococcus sp. SDR]|uniref:ABC transporter ATP-binding protein n=1 Tax=Roseococcus sp. SDR TaxID=2835532 RepID=UPI001BCE0EC3|nr:ABC transporter ATP-binding protein [Roseococcus sp. SDR]MBS7789763.1 ABC transporter ATP-binding protein [Roseococcus sp. SDR]MBV1845077.1 ABC transporter ATP-binding protein [Roseococcus sp. SDR]